MPRPIGNATSSNVEFGELEAERFDAPVAKKTPQPQSQSSQVEPWLGEKKLTFASASSWAVLARAAA